MPSVVSWRSVGGGIKRGNGSGSEERERYNGLGWAPQKKLGYNQCSREIPFFKSSVRNLCVGGRMTHRYTCEQMCLEWGVGGD